jgi:modulator of FtsH protease HflK
MSERDVTPGNFARKVTPKAVLVVVAVVVVLVFGFSSFFVVDQKDEAVILRFGKFLRVSPPGLHFKMPFGIDQNLNVPTQRSLKAEFGFRTERAGVNTVYSSQDFSYESVMLTGDLLIVNVEWIIQYQIIDPRAYLFDVDDQDKTIRDISQSVISQLVGDRQIDAVLTQDRATIEDQARVLMNEFYDKYKLGIRVTTVKLQDVVPPKGPVQAAYEDVNKAIQDRDRSINEGIEAYNQAIPKAEGTARKLVQEAEGYAQRRVNQADGDVARFNAVYKEYRANPAVTRARLYYEMWEEVFADSAESTDLIDRNLQNFLPLKNMGSTQALPQVGAP